MTKSVGTARTRHRAGCKPHRYTIRQPWTGCIASGWMRFPRKCHCDRQTALTPTNPRIHWMAGKAHT